MINKVYVGNLLYETKEEDLVQHFSQVGTVTTATIVRFRNGLSKGFGFVEFETAESAAEAIQRFHNSDFMGRSIIVAEAQPPRPPEEKRADFGGRRGGGFGGGRRGYGGGQGGYQRDNQRGGNYPPRDNGYGRGYDNRSPGIVDSWGDESTSNRGY